MDVRDDWMDVIKWRTRTGEVRAGALTWLVEHPVPSQVSLHRKDRVLENCMDDVLENSRTMKDEERAPSALRSCRGAAVLTHTPSLRRVASSFLSQNYCFFRPYASCVLHSSGTGDR